MKKLLIAISAIAAAVGFTAKAMQIFLFQFVQMRICQQLVTVTMKN